MTTTQGEEIQPGPEPDHFFRVFEVVVGVARSRPPRTDEYRKYLIVARTPSEAELHACWWAAASPGVVMPTSSRIVTAAENRPWR